MYIISSLSERISTDDLSASRNVQQSFPRIVSIASAFKMTTADGVQVPDTPWALVLQKVINLSQLQIITQQHPS
jgi:hypothetical protein